MDMDAMVTDSHQLMMSEEQRHQLFKVKVLPIPSPAEGLTSQMSSGCCCLHLPPPFPHTPTRGSVSGASLRMTLVFPEGSNVDPLLTQKPLLPVDSVFLPVSRCPDFVSVHVHAYV